MNRKITIQQSFIAKNENWKREYENELFTSNDNLQQDILRMHIRNTVNSIGSLLGNIDLIIEDYEELKYNVNWEIDIIKRILNPHHVYEEFNPIDTLN